MAEPKHFRYNHNGLTTNSGTNSTPVTIDDPFAQALVSEKIYSYIPI